MQKPNESNQTRRPIAKPCLWKRGGWYLLLSFFVGMGVLSVLLCSIAGMMLLTDASDGMLSCMIGVSLVTAGYAMGYCAGVHRHRHGMRVGFLCGLVLTGVLVFAGLVWRGDCGGWLRCLLLLLSSTSGGIVGVNQNHVARM